jgi:hypothetical protein
MGLSMIVEDNLFGDGLKDQLWLDTYVVDVLLEFPLSFQLLFKAGLNTIVVLNGLLFQNCQRIDDVLPHLSNLRQTPVFRIFEFLVEDIHPFIGRFVEG